MKNDKIDDLFKNLQDEFDVEVPTPGHEQRFLDKLKSARVEVIESKFKSTWQKPFLAIAASVIVCLGLFTFLRNEPVNNDLASVSPELSQTQDFFTTAITTELNKINTQRNPENEVLIADALKQMDLLENNYETLKRDLKESGNDKRVIYAMISNFQSRIDILENVLKTIEEQKQLKNSETQIIL